MFSPVNVRLIHAIKHQVHIRHHPRILLHQLQESPESEHHPTLHAGVVKIRIESPIDNHDPKCSELLSFLHMLLRDPGLAPGLKVPVDKLEELGAILGLSSRPGTDLLGLRRSEAVVATAEVRALEDLVSESVFALFVELFRRENVPGRRV